MLCIYHKNCADGLAAALAVKLYCWEKGIEFESMTTQYGDTPPDITGKEVMIVDFSYSRDQLLAMHESAKSLVVLDHHKTSEAALTGLDFCHFDQSKSGAVLTWEYLFPTTPLPELFKYVQDRDLWTWLLPQSREVSAALRSYPPFFDVWEQFLTPKSIEALKAEGGAILRYQQREIDSALSRPIARVVIGGYDVPCVNCTHLISELGNDMAQNEPFAALYFDTEDKRVFSLRSTDEGIDVSAIAKQYGGGGHRNAAGFSVPKPKVI